MKPREVSEKIFWEKVGDEIDRARSHAIKTGNHPDRLQYWFSEDESGEINMYPCIYSNDERRTVWCPVTENDYPSLKPPKSMKGKVLQNVGFLRHAADTTCVNLRMNISVRCYALVDDKYFICEHKVGRCPWKE